MRISISIKENGANAINLIPDTTVIYSIPEKSQLLTTTVRPSLTSTSPPSSGFSLKSLGGDYFRKLFPVISADSIPSWASSNSGQLVAAGGAAIILLDRLQTASDLSSLCEEQAKNITMLSAQLQTASAPAKNEEPPQLNEASPQLKELQARLEALTTEFEARGAEIGRLTAATQQLQRELALPPQEAVQGQMQRDLADKEAALELLQIQLLSSQQRGAQSERAQEQLLSAVRELLVARGLLAQGLANMLLPGSAADSLRELALQPAAPSPAALALEEAETQLAQLRQQTRTELEQQARQILALQSQQAADRQAAASLETTLQEQTARAAQLESALQQSQRALISSQAQAEEARLEVQGLRQRLQAAEQSPAEGELESKLQAARAMTKELSQKLQAKERQLEERDRKLGEELLEGQRDRQRLQEELDLLRLQLARPAPEELPDPEPAKKHRLAAKVAAKKPSGEGLLGELKALKPYQIRSMTKKDLETSLAKLGTHTNAAGLQTSLLLKAELAALLEARLSEL
eukprot:CAMPEP_0170063766 /NCGR_PEP_ID=MMETSP0019_2-20121128/4512_1 /TAXON_ID=98059 /ORGANISM="Dinobryon sp., Strain UTEXLB2267" /LENGTH=522 /DNA_ID=CAMNT_0010270281 /DNA_START=1391 /DNA_END=2960 /DNA_ORIENTATION=+